MIVKSLYKIINFILKVLTALEGKFSMLLNVVFAGTVQGVGFRKFVKDIAAKMGVKGLVRNLPDGTVEVVAEGDEELLRKFLEAIEEGPPLAEVTHMAYEFRNKEGGFDKFEIEY